MPNAKDIECPVEKCNAAVGSQCKLVNMQKHPMLGSYHLDRIRAVAKKTREENMNKKQDAGKLLRSTDRVFVFS